MAVSSRIRIGAIASLLATLALAFSGLSSAAPTIPDPEEPGERMALRLHDLPPGYFPLSLGAEGTSTEFTCDRLHPTDSSRRLSDFVERFRPAGCFGLYMRLYRVPGPAPTSALVGTGSMRAKTTAGATAGLAAAGELLGKLVEKKRDLEETAPPATVGDATRLFHWRHVPPFLLGNPPFGSFVVWRSGGVVSATFATAPSFADSDRIAVELAQRQQVHVEHPTPYTAAERDASEVSLDNPAATFPVRWLGHEFAPGKGLPRVELGGGYVEPLPGTVANGAQLQLQYGEEIEIEGWTSAGWKHFVDTREGRALKADNCAKPIEVSVPEGRAKIFTGHSLAYEPCRKAPKRYYAIVRVDGNVIGVNFTRCPDCVDRDPYNSVKGMKAIVRGLVLRPKPVY